ncbi:DNA circularization N-terminal domain-containing protein [Bosea sp. BK604]|uniref:DNA circularization N-terminal domain-containing protein n=1 Tax=Bosea sp. BK604 TaxID=2512180 RepID=UPI0010459055|nr:DNA circularization N-terminal domain-containing protein [Bosea sp. BK604]TCR60938.1 DNA circularization protein [Bosea sp. BK604]
MSEWRDRLRPASFRGVEFHVELGARSGGRRLAPHEYPKRDDPYTEDMGRRGRAFSVIGYLIGPVFTADRDALIDALEREGAGQLVLPTGLSMRVMCTTYNSAERRERGGYVEIDMQFLEAGTQEPLRTSDDTQAKVTESAEKASASTTATANETISV